MSLPYTCVTDEASEAQGGSVSCPETFCDTVEFQHVNALGNYTALEHHILKTLLERENAAMSLTHPVESLQRACEQT